MQPIHVRACRSIVDEQDCARLAAKKQLADQRGKSSCGRGQVCSQYHGTFQEDLWLKTKPAWVKMASHFPDVGRDDHSAPSDSTWLRGALAHGNKKTSMAVPKVLNCCARYQQGSAAATPWCLMSTAEQCRRDEGSMHEGISIVGFPMRQGGSRGRCRRRGA
jgi:hypothetical protein